MHWSSLRTDRTIPEAVLMVGKTSCTCMQVTQTLRSSCWQSWIILLEDTYISQLVLNLLICMTVTNTWTMRTRKESPQIRFSATLSFWHKINMNWKRLRSRDTTYRNIDYKTEWLDVVIFQNEKTNKQTKKQGKESIAIAGSARDDSRLEINW